MFHTQEAGSLKRRRKLVILCLTASVKTATTIFVIISTTSTPFVNPFFFLFSDLKFCIAVYHVFPPRRSPSPVMSTPPQPGSGGYGNPPRPQQQYYQQVWNSCLHREHMSILFHLEPLSCYNHHSNHPEWIALFILLSYLY